MHPFFLAHSCAMELAILFRRKPRCIGSNRGLAYNLLQGARARISKTEFVACLVVDALFLIFKTQK